MAAVAGNWQPRALCRGNHSHLFFPPSTFERKDERERREIRAKAICIACPVKGDCLDVGRGYSRAVRYLGWIDRSRAPGILSPDGLRLQSFSGSRLHVAVRTLRRSPSRIVTRRLSRYSKSGTAYFRENPRASLKSATVNKSGNFPSRWMISSICSGR